MPAHPFTLPYIGLGLLDEPSIRRDGEIWTAEYPDTSGRPYLVARIHADHVRLEEFEDGKRVDMTAGGTLASAIGQHGKGALLGEASRFWLRVVRDLSNVWVQISGADVRYGFVPAIGLAELTIPLPGGMRWIPPTPGPIANRIGLNPFDETTEVMTGTLLRTIREEPTPRVQAIKVVKATMPGILIPEAAEAYFEAFGGLRSIEWRPYVLPAPDRNVSRSWQSIQPVTYRDGSTLTGFAVIADVPASRVDRGERIDSWSLTST
jgi:hypothetical protein